MDKKTLAKVYRVAFASVVMQTDLKSLEPLRADACADDTMVVEWHKVENILAAYHKTAYIGGKGGKP